jgi:hypothetical protein
MLELLRKVVDVILHFVITSLPMEFIVYYS